VRDLAELVSRLTGARIAWLPNPRKEAEENDLVVRNDQFLALGLDPTRLQDGLLAEVVGVAKKFAHRIDRSRVPAVSAWTRDLAALVVHDPEGRALRSVGCRKMRRAYVTLVTNADYLPGAVALARSLRRTGTKAGIVAMHTGGAPAGMLAPLAALGV